MSASQLINIPVAAAAVDRGGDGGRPDQGERRAEQGEQAGEDRDPVAAPAPPHCRAARAAAHRPGESEIGGGELPFDLDQDPPFALAEDHAGVLLYGLRRMRSRHPVTMPTADAESRAHVYYYE